MATCHKEPWKNPFADDKHQDDKSGNAGYGSTINRQREDRKLRCVLPIKKPREEEERALAPSPAMSCTTSQPTATLPSKPSRRLRASRALSTTTVDAQLKHIPRITHCPIGQPPKVRHHVIAQKAESAIWHTQPRGRLVFNFEKDPRVRS